MMPHASAHPAPSGERPEQGGAPHDDRRVATFEAFRLHPDLLKGIHDLGFIRPTPIQAQAIPAILSGRDVIGCAQTGTGKTAAFVLPILHRLLQGKSGAHLRTLILAPTRELALQSMEHLRALSRYVHLKGAAIFGGVPMEPQISALARGLDIISATPGRLLDHIYSGRIDFGSLEVLVLDEVDRMLDMGFLPDIKKIIRLLPPERQNLAFSATLPAEIVALVHEILRNPVTIQIGQRSSSPVGIRHAVYPVPRHLKTDLLLELLRGQGMTSVLVFTRTKHYADRLSQKLERAGIRVSVLHGDRSQSQRLRALEQFRRGRSQVMVATDVAARGIDIEDISHVINFDIPETPENYVHRIGRTARAEATGDAFSLVDRSEEPLISAIERLLNRTLPRVTLPHFDYKRPAPNRPHEDFRHRDRGRRHPPAHPAPHHRKPSS
ncbi:MAG TPA: RNA helicase [Candidatus Omnitrophica bacterium]|nr:RNA helicase [Candidatus Omnitrophota bacterium]HBH97113.1 RNA helicase [Candidatus Omnitrophota bacterium]HBQ37874.1 RNA helicase [Candidatus Omnitrophota bacterium]